MKNDYILKISLIIIVILFVILALFFVKNIQTFDDGEELSVGNVPRTPSAKVSVDIIAPEEINSSLVESNARNEN